MIPKPKKWPSMALALISSITYFSSGEEADAQTRALTAYIWTRNTENRRGGRRNTQSLMRRANNLGVTVHNISRTNARAQLRDLQPFLQYNDGHQNPGRVLNDMFNSRLGRRHRSNLNFVQWERSRRIDLAQLGATYTSLNGLARIAGPFSTVRSGRIETNTSVHEIGHNYNGIHSQAHSFLGNRLSLMGGRQGNRHNRFSNPSVRVRGQATGTGSRNNARRIRDRRVATSRRR